MPSESMSTMRACGSNPPLRPSAYFRVPALTIPCRAPTEPRLPIPRGLPSSLPSTLRRSLPLSSMTNRGRRSRNSGSMYLSHRSSGSRMCPSASTTLYARVIGNPSEGDRNSHILPQPRYPTHGSERAHVTRIASVKPHPISVPLNDPVWTAHEKLTSSSVIVVEVRTDDGLTGYGQIHGSPMKAICAWVERFGEIVRGMDALAHVAVWDRLFSLTCPRPGGIAGADGLPPPCGFHRGPARRRAGRAARGHDRAAHRARAARASRRGPAALRLRRGIARRCGAQPPVAPPPGRRPRDARQLRSPQRQAGLRSGDRLGLRPALRGLIRGARLLRGDRATHRRAMHQTALGHVVVLDRPVLDHAVVPHQHVARVPSMAIHERGLDDVIRQCGDQRLRLVGLHPLDAGTVVTHHVEALAPRRRMGPHDGMADRRGTVDFRLSRRKGPFAPPEIEHGPPSLEGALHRVGQGVPGRGGAGELG